MANQVMLTGNITNDLEIKQAGQSQVLKFGLGVRDNFKKDQTNFVDIEAWGKAAEIIAQYCHKGSKIMVIGELKQDRFTDRDGNKRSKLKVNVDRFEFLDSKGNSNQQPNQQQGQAQGNTYVAKDNPFANSNPNLDISSDQLPF